MGLQGFKDRPLSYKVATVLVLCSGMFVAIGVACPYWYVDGSGHGGLWSVCHTDSDCVDLTASLTEGWWLAVQVLVPLGLVCVTLSCSCLLFENCFSDVHAPRHVQEALGIIGGLLGVIGCFVFVGKTKSGSSGLQSSHSWAFYFTVLGCVVVVVACVVMVVLGRTAGKTWRTSRPGEEDTATDPPRRFSHLWAHQSPSTPEILRRPLPPPPYAGDVAHELSTPRTPHPTPACSHDVSMLESNNDPSGSGSPL